MPTIAAWIVLAWVLLFAGAFLSVALRSDWPMHVAGALGFLLLVGGVVYESGKWSRR